MILDKIVERKKEEVRKAKKGKPLRELKDKACGSGNMSMFKSGISRKGKLNLIAEIKKSSPSKGIICSDFDPARIAWEYQNSGAAAISVLTDERFFDGRMEYLKVVKDKVSVPLLRKDFIVDEYQVYESLVGGADAILLISRILSRGQLQEYLEISKSLNLDCLVEVHSEVELDKVLSTDAGIIGVNNRDLSTFQVDVSRTQQIAKYIPGDKIIVSESGIENYEQIIYLKNLGVNAVLIGGTFMRSNEISQKIREVMGEEV